MVKLLRFKMFNESSTNEMSLITLDDVLNIQKETVENFGGKIGVRDMNQLMSCINKIYMSVFGEDAYPTIYEKAAAFFEGVVNTHPLLDGNKRTAFEGMLFILSKENISLLKTYNESRRFIVNVVNKQMSIDEISRWIRRNSKVDLIKGGLSDKESIDTLSDKHNVSVDSIKDQLNKGIKVEMEHTNSKEIAKEIAMDHLSEMPDYYNRLAELEKNK